MRHGSVLLSMAIKLFYRGFDRKGRVTGTCPNLRFRDVQDQHIAVVVCLLLLLVVIFAVSAIAEPTYDRRSALDYARAYWDKTCSDGYYFAHRERPTLLGSGKPFPTDGEGFDCAHFVSCCIGSEPRQPGGGLDVPSRTPAYGEPGAQRLVDWLIEQGSTRVARISEMVPGDVVAYDADHDGWIDHVALYMGMGVVTAHSISRYSRWNPDPEARIALLHLPGAYEPSLRTLGLEWIGWAVMVVVVVGLLGMTYLLIRQ